MEQFTYAAIKKPAQRQEMLNEDVSSLGTQSGNYGLFTEQARVLTLSGSKAIKEELRKLALLISKDSQALLDNMPTLKKLIK